MQDIIQLLPDSLANQIAAGEVVQRPASIVKELLENAIDAKSKKIKLYVKEAGKSLIQVIDDGIGMSETDARLSFERHATSKIKKTEDLFSIHTMGFRGEALASIAAVAQVELKSKRAVDDLGTMLKISGSKLEVQETVQIPTGTSISVKNLFFNVPARRNFLKSNGVEMRHILDEFHRVALANADIDFSLYHNDVEIYHLRAGKLVQRIIGIFGKNYKKNLLVCKEETPIVNIRGYIGRPESAKKTRGEQFFFVNNRFVKQPYLHHAVKIAFEGLIPKDAHPFYTIFMELPPQTIDINIHPTKTEVKFEDERSIYAILLACAKKALSVHNLTPSLDFSEHANFSFRDTSKNVEQNTLSNQGSSQWGNSKPKSKSVAQWDKIYEGLKKETLAGQQEISRESMTIFQSALNQQQDENSELINITERTVLQIHQQYILTQVRSGLMLINQQGAYERIFYDKFLKNLNTENPKSQQVLFPVEIDMNPADLTLVGEIEQEIKNLGFVFDIKDNNKILLRGVPTGLGKENEQELFEGLVEQVKNYKSTIDLDKNVMVVKALAKKASLKKQKTLDKIEMNYLIDSLFASTNPNFTPNGNSIIVILSLDEMANLFSKTHI